MLVPFPSASLYVGDLFPDVSEGHLFETFNRVGPVASIRVCRDAITRRSLGYAYVNFHNLADAEKALDTLNNTLIKSKPCRVMWSQRDPSLRKSGVGNIFIKNLDKSIDHKALYDTFSVFGNILSCKVAMGEDNVSRGYGFVHYETQEQASKAVQKVNGMMLKGKTIFVAPFLPRKERQKTLDESKFTNVFIKNLDDPVSTEKLHEVFGRYGPLTSVILMTDFNGKSKCFGFVNFENPHDAQKAVEELNGKTINGSNKPIYVARAQKKSERQLELRQKFESRPDKSQGVNLYVKHLDDDVDDEVLKNEFAVFGNIASVKIMRDEKNNSKGFGFVCFRNPEDASKALAEMSGRLFGSKPLYVALAQKKQTRRALLEEQFLRKVALRTPAPANNLGFPMYHPTAHLFYPQPMVYPPQPAMIPRTNRLNVAPQMGQYQLMPNFPGQMQPRQPRHTGGRQNPPTNRRNAGGGGFNRGREPRDHGQPQSHQMVIPVPSQSAIPLSVPLVPDSAASLVGTNPILTGTDHHVGLTEDFLSQLAPEEQSQIIGERLYQLIAKSQPDYAGKITGMLLERYTSPLEMLLFLDNSDALNEKINEAMAVLQEHAVSEPGPGGVVQE